MKKILKKLIILVLIGLVLGSGLVLIINYHVISYSNKYIVSLEEVPKSEAALVLGALVYRNGTVSTILADRLDTGIELYNNKSVEKLLLSGDHGQKTYDEVNAMKQYAVSQDIDNTDIFMDHAGFNTYESMYRARDVFLANKIIIVTQGYHLHRAVYNARKLGLEAYGVSADKHYYPGIKSYKLRESLARVKDYFLVNFLKIEPTYLEETIDIRGDGTVTDDKK